MVLAYDRNRTNYLMASTPVERARQIISLFREVWLLRRCLYSATDPKEIDLRQSSPNNR